MGSQPGVSASFGPTSTRPGSVGPAVWAPPTEIEQALFETKSREDWAACFDALAREPLYFEMQRDKEDTDPDKSYSVFGRDPRAGGPVWAVCTAGMLPAPDPHRVFHRSSLGWFAEAWKPGRPPWIVVNPGGPREAFPPDRHATPSSHHTNFPRFPNRADGCQPQ